MMKLSIARLVRLFLGLAALTSSLPRLSAGVTLVATNANWRYARGTNEASLPDTTAWRFGEFSDANWPSGPAPFFYGEPIVGGTTVADMQNGYYTLFLRTRFTVEDPSNLGLLSLHAVIDDGMIAWINGHEVARYNVRDGEPTAFTNALAAVGEPHQWQTFLADGSSLLPGENVLAIQLFNATLESSDIVFDGELTASPSQNPAPFIVSVSPSPGEVTNLTSMVVTFSEPVKGVTAPVLLLNGFSATAVAGSGTTWTFQVNRPDFGNVHVAWLPNHGITDLDVPAARFNEAGATASWDYVLLDPDAPSIALRLPPVGARVRRLGQVEVRFSEAVEGVLASSLLVNGQPAVEVAGVGAGPYVFSFPVIDSGEVRLSWANGHAIHDLGGQKFVGAEWRVTVDPATPPPGIRINEFLAINISGLKDDFAETEAWIELYNAGTAPVNLAGWALTDDPETPDQWVFPSVTVGPGAYYTLFTSGRDLRDPARPMHTNFKLSRTGEYLGLFNSESPRVAVSELSPEYPAQRNDYSYGLNPAGQWRYFAKPTPGTSNGDSTISGACEPVHFSATRGHYSKQPFDVFLSCPTPDSRILYTLNGSEPGGTNGFAYTGSIRIDKIVTLRAIAERDGMIPSPVATHTYLYDLTSGKRTLPAVSLVTATNNITGPKGIVGIKSGSYQNTLFRGIAWERPVSMEYIQPADNSGFQVDAGLRLQSSDYLRPIATPADKFSWRVYFRSDYGPGRLRYPVIPISPVDENDVIVLRAGHNDDLNPFVKDELARRLFADLGQVSSLGSHCLVYLNGKIMPGGGFYNMVERIEADFLQAHHGGSDKWDVLSQGAQVLDGSNSDFLSLISLSASKPLSNAVNYAAFSKRLDLTNFVDYLLVNVYAFNGDWPHNNWRAARERVAGKPWRFYVWDAEFGFGTYGRSVTGNTFNEDLGGTTEIPTLHARLMKSPEYKLLFADRIQRAFLNDGPLSPTNVTLRFNELKAEMAGVIPSMDRFILTTWVPQRPKAIFTHFRQLGLWSSNAPAFRQHGGVVPSGFELTMTNQSGEMFYTTDGSDPRVALTGEVAPAARQYAPATPPVVIDSSVFIARSRSNGVWSAATSAEFRVAEIGLPLRISEIMYNPPGGAGYEFIEIANTADRAVNVGGVGFSGVEFVFPIGTIMPAKAIWIVASDINPVLFAQRYPGVVVSGWFRGSLSNGGERLGLLAPSGSPIETVDYRDGSGWPTAADGEGASLERLDLSGDPDDAAAWRASTAAGGTPGLAVVPSPAGDERLREVYAAGGSQGADYVRIGVSQGAYSAAGLRLSVLGRPDTFTVTNAPPPGTGPVETIWFDEVVDNSDRHTGFGLPREGGTVLAERLSGGAVVWRDFFTYGPQAEGSALVRSWDGTGQIHFELVAPLPSRELQQLGSTASLVINEWLANALPGDDDWVELHNTDPLRPVALAGCVLAVSNSVHRIALPTYIAPGGFLRLRADENAGPDHLDFKLPAAWGTLRLLGPNAQVIDQASWVNAVEGVSRGRLPDGTADLANFTVPTPGASNSALPSAGPFLNEILARPSAGAGWIEVSNPGTAPVDIGGWSIIVRSRDRREWRFPSGATLAAGAVVRLHADPLSAPSAGLILAPGTTELADRFNLGFGLPDFAASIQWATAAGVVVDSVSYGPQLAGKSIGRTAGGWQLLETPTPNLPNGPAQTLGTSASIRLNEWAPGDQNHSSFVELYNPAAQPVAIGGFRMTDDPTLAGINKFVLPPLGFVAPGAWAAFATDPSRLAWDQEPQLPFEVSHAGETLRLYDSVSNLVDSIAMPPFRGSGSAGRLPDGADSIVEFATPTPLAGNLTDTDSDGMVDSWEMANGLDPRDPSDAGLDADNDGASNLAEYYAGTDPRSAASVLRLDFERVGASEIRISFGVVAGRTYRLQFRSDADASWSFWPGVLPAPDAAQRITVLLDPGVGSDRLFRVVVTPP